MTLDISGIDAAFWKHQVPLQRLHVSLGKNPHSLGDIAVSRT